MIVDYTIILLIPPFQPGFSGLSTARMAIPPAVTSKRNDLGHQSKESLVAFPLHGQLPKADSFRKNSLSLGTKASFCEEGNGSTYFSVW